MICFFFLCSFNLFFFSVKSFSSFNEPLYNILNKFIRVLIKTTNCRRNNWLVLFIFFNCSLTNYNKNILFEAEEIDTKTKPQRISKHAEPTILLFFILLYTVLYCTSTAYKLKVLKVTNHILFKYRL